MADLLDTIAEHWDERASTFDDEVDHGLVAPAARAAWTRRLSTWLLEPPARVADLGCGTWLTRGPSGLLRVRGDRLRHLS